NMPSSATTTASISTSKAPSRRAPPLIGRKYPTVHHDESGTKEPYTNYMRRGHYCGAPNETVPGTCERWLVNHTHCADHRGPPSLPGPSHHRSGRPPRPPRRRRRGPSEDRTALLLADVLTDGRDRAVAKRVVQYVGHRGARQLRS